MSKSLVPQNDRVLIKPIESGEEMYGNIIIPDMGKEKPEMGEVVAVGPGRQSCPSIPWMTTQAFASMLLLP